jgi:hypothetical protein
VINTVCHGVAPDHLCFSRQQGTQERPAVGVQRYDKFFLSDSVAQAYDIYVQLEFFDGTFSDVRQFKR